MLPNQVTIYWGCTRLPPSRVNPYCGQERRLLITPFGLEEYATVSICHSDGGIKEVVY